MPLSLPPLTAVEAPRTTLAHPPLFPKSGPLLLLPLPGLPLGRTLDLVVWMLSWPVREGAISPPLKEGVSTSSKVFAPGPLERYVAFLSSPSAGRVPPGGGRLRPAPAFKKSVVLRHLRFLGEEASVFVLRRALELTLPSAAPAPPVGGATSLIVVVGPDLPSALGAGPPLEQPAVLAVLLLPLGVGVVLPRRAVVSSPSAFVPRLRFFWLLWDGSATLAESSDGSRYFGLVCFAQLLFLLKL